MPGISVSISTMRLEKTKRKYDVEMLVVVQVNHVPKALDLVRAIPNRNKKRFRSNKPMGEGERQAS